MHLIILASILHTVSSNSIITTTSGPIRSTNGLVDEVDAFLGIPYAEPPTGERRFAKPVPKAKWNETYEASSIPPPCAQVKTEPSYFMPNTSNMSEDCLYLNIWTPKSKCRSGLRPIIIFLHSGLYMYGSASLKAHDGSKLARHGDLIVASVNYRLGAFGFFWGFTEEAPGSLGVWDQIMAIKWLKENAEQFGGDPETIILMGSSVGAYNTALFTLSPLTQNLFRRVIIQSGGVVTPIFEDNNKRLSESSEILAEITGCVNETVSLRNNSKIVVDCLRGKSVESIVEAQQIMLMGNSAPFGPRVYDEILPKPPSDLIREGNFRRNISVLAGITKDEGSMMLTFALPQYFGMNGREGVEITSRLRARTFARGIITMLKVADSSKIGQLYVDKVKNGTSAEYMKSIGNIVGDFIVTCPTVFTANFLSLSRIPVYFYKFSFRSPLTPLAEWMGTTHLDEIQYVFGNPYHENFTSEEIELSHHMMDIWSAFAWTGHANIHHGVLWPQYSYQKPIYLNFGQNQETLELGPSETCEFWKKIFRADYGESFTEFLEFSGGKRL